MNRRSLIITLVGLAIVPVELMGIQPQRKPMRPQLHIPENLECKACTCKKKCKCKCGCCKTSQSTILGSDPERPPQGRPPQNRPYNGRPSPSRHSRYKEMVKRFDKNKDGKLDEKEKANAKKYFTERYKNHNLSK